MDDFTIPQKQEVLTIILDTALAAYRLGLVASGDPEPNEDDVRAVALEVAKQVVEGIDMGRLDPGRFRSDRGEA